MDKKVYGVDIDKCNGINADDIGEMTPEQKKGLIAKVGTDEEYTIDGFFYYLNNNMIDTENKYWIVV